MPTDVWKLKLDGSGERVRMTRMVERKPWRSSNPVVSPDGKWLAFMINLHSSEAGYGMGLGLLDLEAWGKSDYANQWDVPNNPDSRK
jgi:Tol biopolymer transport system component